MGVARRVVTDGAGRLAADTGRVTTAVGPIGIALGPIGIARGPIGIARGRIATAATPPYRFGFASCRARPRVATRLLHRHRLPQLPSRPE
ncbi:MAG: hypothetical protein AB7V44_20630, partial [Pseudonocardia sp.]